MCLRASKLVGPAAGLAWSASKPCRRVWGRWVRRRTGRICLVQAESFARLSSWKNDEHELYGHARGRIERLRLAGRMGDGRSSEGLARAGRPPLPTGNWPTFTMHPRGRANNAHFQEWFRMRSDLSGLQAIFPPPSPQASGVRACMPSPWPACLADPPRLLGAAEARHVVRDWSMD